MAGSSEPYTNKHGSSYQKTFDSDIDPFKNFSYHPPKSQGHMRSFTRRNRYNTFKMMGSRDRLGSNSSLNMLSGSTHSLLDPTRMMSMQEDAKSKKISAEVMKNRLYESVVASPRRRRMSARADYMTPTRSESQDFSSFSEVARMVQSLPVTPAASQNVSPVQSPTSSRRFFGYFSRGATPHVRTPEEIYEDQWAEVQEDSWKGLASLFKPQPRYVSAASKYSPKLEYSAEMDEESENGQRSYLSSVESNNGLFSSRNFRNNPYDPV